MRPFPWLALLFAPLVSIPVAILFALSFPPAYFEGAFVVPLCIAWALLEAYAGMIVIGLPAFLILRRHGQVNRIRLAFVGLFAPLLACLLTGAPVFLLSAATGLAVALVGWNLAPEGPAVPLSKQGPDPGMPPGAAPAAGDSFLGPDCSGSGGPDCSGSLG